MRSDPPRAGRSGASSRRTASSYERTSPFSSSSRSDGVVCCLQGRARGGADPSSLRGPLLRVRPRPLQDHLSGESRPLARRVRRSARPAAVGAHLESGQMHRGFGFTTVALSLIVTASACLPLARVPTTSAPLESASPTLSPAASASLIPAGPSPSPSPTAASTTDIHVTAVPAMPADPHFFAVGAQDSTRILLFDSSATRPPVEVVRFDPAPLPSPDVRTIAFGASADGRVLVFARRFSEQRTVHYLGRPQTGEVIVLLTDLARSFSVPVVAPDGSRYAYARLGDANGTGVFIADARAGPDPKRIVAADPQIVGLPPQPVEGSADGAWLPASTSDTGGSRIGVGRC